MNYKLTTAGEFRAKANRLEGTLGGCTLRNEDAWDIFAAYALNRNISLTVAY